MSIDQIVADEHSETALPVPTPDGITTLGQAVGYFVQWPRDRVIFDDQVSIYLF